ncbi:MAG: methylenetetrahydrofolate reductase [NAD(P)H] [Lachnospiraceae bacterium]|nr:methylenetetrahydrofolate reductase [NAD(P)H] [Lachnospiraceae bacterium]
MINEKYGEKTLLSFEIFPPKRNDDIYEIYKTLDQIKELNPDFISVTYGAGGSNSKKTSTLAAYIQNVCDVEALAHITAVGLDDDGLDAFINELKKKGVYNVLALRGDKPRAMTDEEFSNRHFKYASDIIPKIKNTGDMFVAAACYPEIHPESANQKNDIEFLKYKIDQGVDCLITQMFFDNAVYYNFMEQLAKNDISIPVHAGIMPITAVNQLGTSVSLSGSSVPNELSTLIAKYADNTDDMKKAGIEYAVNQINDLKANHVAGIHLYTMNKAEVTKEIYKATF